MRLLSKSSLAAIAALILGTSFPAFADTPVTYTDAGRALFRFDVPDFWLLRTGGIREIEDTELKDLRAVSRVMGIRPVSDDSVWMGFVSPAGVATIDGGFGYLADIDKFLVKDPQISSDSNVRIGGLPARVVRGTGRRDGRGVNFTATVINLPRNRVAVAVTVMRDDANPEFVNDLNAVFASFRAAN